MAFVFSFINMSLELIVLTISIIQYNVISVDSKITKTAYFNYLTEVVDHICIQNGWKSMDNLNLSYFTLDSIGISSVSNLVTQNFKRSDNLSTFYNIVHILNYRYNEILLIFVELLNIVIDECLNYYGAELLINFTDCSFLLGKAIKNSLTMFESLYNALIFISYIDLNLRNNKIVNFELECNPFITVDNIYELKNHKYFKKIQNEDHYNNLLDIKEFIGDVSKFANDFFEKNKFIMDNFKKFNFKAIYEKVYMSHAEDFLSFVSFMYNKINSFYTEAIMNNYENFGFVQLINPTDSKFIPPKDKTIDQDCGITILNTLLIQGNWDSCRHVNIQYDDLKISAKRVIRDLTTDHNFHLKKHYFTQMVRCRFFEVLLNYNTLLSALKQLCITLKNENNYVKCVTCLFDAINDTVTMFDFMLTIIEKIKLSSIWQPNKSYSDLQSTHKLILDYVFNLKVFNVVREKFIYTPEVNTEVLAADYIQNYKKARRVFSKNLQTSKHPKNNRCYIDDFIVNKESIVFKFQDIANDRSSETHITEYELITKFLNNFCRSFIQNDYVNTGFDKIYQNYFWKWT
ncbi:uncharacterized protein LOC126907595 [Daktulosphaira vitifoliae]|uniref:uncharacterized protein LOC126907595 n=1 Tax=Daktulosphaira vitifoliae TaxID=58002 RepID=UPI0021AA0CF7|nr:uncharacterized protein LOC126907595 [Daktulosphaira vitifoliae]